MLFRSKDMSKIIFWKKSQLLIFFVCDYALFNLFNISTIILAAILDLSYFRKKYTFINIKFELADPKNK